MKSWFCSLSSVGGRWSFWLSSFPSCSSFAGLSGSEELLPRTPRSGCASHFTALAVPMESSMHGKTLYPVLLVVVKSWWMPGENPGVLVPFPAGCRHILKEYTLLLLPLPQAEDWVLISVLALEAFVSMGMRGLKGSQVWWGLLIKESQEALSFWIWASFALWLPWGVSWSCANVKWWCSACSTHSQGAAEARLIYGSGEANRVWMQQQCNALWISRGWIH